MTPTGGSELISEERSVLMLTVLPPVGPEQNTATLNGSQSDDQNVDS